MGVAASASSPPAEAAAPADPPAKEDIQHGDASAAAAAHQEAAAPADSPAKEATQPAADADAPGGGADAAGETVVLDASAEGGEEEEGECGFCLFMKGGGCKEEFVGWEKCVEQADAEGGDVVERCYDVTAALRKCMDKYPDYYEPILRAERAMAEDLEAFKAEAEAKASEASPASPPPPAAEEEQGDSKKQAEAVMKEKEDLAV